MRQVSVPVTPLLRFPHAQAPRESEMIFGEHCEIMHEEDDYLHVKTAYDSYEGYVLKHDLGEPSQANYKVKTLKTFVYKEANIKSPVVMALPFLAQLTVLSITDNFAQIPQGFVYLPHLVEVSHFETDFVRVAERFLGLPYLWGGNSSFGLDCSALIHIALKACGHAFPRDSTPQSLKGAKVAGQPQRGNLIFWQGHVGVMQNENTLLHANGHTMTVALEGFKEAKARINTPLLGVKRL